MEENYNNSELLKNFGKNKKIRKKLVKCIKWLNSYDIDSNINNEYKYSFDSEWWVDIILLFEHLIMCFKNIFKNSYFLEIF